MLNIGLIKVLFMIPKQPLVNVILCIVVKIRWTFSRMVENM